MLVEKGIKKYFKFPIFVSNYKRFWSKIGNYFAHFNAI